MSTITIIIIIATLSLTSATGRQISCDKDAARALKFPWAPVAFHGERETESLPEIDARFTPDGDADEAAGFRAVDAFNEMEPIPALGKAYVPGSPHRASALARRAATDVPLRFAVLDGGATFHHLPRIVCQFWALPRLGWWRTALAGRGLRRGRGPPRPVLPASRGALPVDVGPHARVAPVRRRPFHRERWGGWWAGAREDPRGRERGLPLVHLTCAYQSSSSNSSSSAEYSSPSDEAAGSG